MVSELKRRADDRRKPTLHRHRRLGSRTWVDPGIGARCQREFADRFFLRFMGDIGGFGVSSDFTWQALAGLGYQINDAASVVIGYRGVGSDYAEDDFGYDVISHGLLTGFECKF